jgi:hypothetical protein
LVVAITLSQKAYKCTAIYCIAFCSTIVIHFSCKTLNVREVLHIILINANFRAIDTITPNIVLGVYIDKPSWHD